MTTRTVTRAITKLRLVRRFAQQYEALKPVGWSDDVIAEWVCHEAKLNDPGVRVSRRSLRRWRDDYDRIGPDGLTAGPAALLPRYVGRPSRRKETTPSNGC